MKNQNSLISSMSDEDVWLKVKELGASDALSVISETTPEQFQYILDIELWKKDKWLVDNALTWLSVVKECGREKIIQWAHETDLDNVILTLKEFVTIQKKGSPEDNPLEHEWPNNIAVQTMEGVYFYQPTSKEADAFIRDILETIAKDDHEFYMRLCEAVISELKSNLEESAFSWRAKRLAEKGFPCYEEAVQVYKYLSERNIKNLPKRKKVNVENAPKYPLALQQENYPVLLLALAEIKDESLLNEISLELATTANKVLIADGRPINPETLLAELKKALGYINIGLEYLSGADSKQAAAVLSEHWCQNLFQVGYTLIARLRQSARRFIRYCNVELLGSDAPLILYLDKKRPLYFTGEVQEDGRDAREFRSLDEIMSIEREIEKYEYVARMFSEVFGFECNALAAALEGHPNATFQAALLTIWAKGVVTGNYIFSPVTEKEFSTLLKKIKGKSDVSSKFIAWLIERQPNANEKEKRMCSAFVEDCINRFKDEYEEMPDVETPDIKLVELLWVIPKEISA